MYGCKIMGQYIVYIKENTKTGEELKRLSGNVVFENTFQVSQLMPEF